MPASFQPRFKNLQSDLERYLASIGKKEETEEGMVIFHGYPEGLWHMFDLYLEAEAWDPLLVHFRDWNWEAGGNDYLLELTGELEARADWPRLEKLWSCVVAKQSKLYNEVWTLEQKHPGSLPEATRQEAGQQLLGTLERVVDYARKTEEPAWLEQLAAMLEAVRMGKRAPAGRRPAVPGDEG